MDTQLWLVTDMLRSFFTRKPVLVLSVLLLILGMFSVGWLLSRLGPSQAKPLQPETATRFPSPSFPKPPGIISPPQYKTTNLNGAVPLQIPLYRNERPETDQEFVSRVAARFNFHSAPQTEQTERGPALTWNENGETLRLGGSPFSLIYEQGSPKLNPRVKLDKSDTEYTAVIQQLVTQLQLFSPELSLSPAKTEYLLRPVSGVEYASVPRVKANVISLHYKLLLEEGEVFTSPPKEYVVTATLDGEGTILSFFAQIFPYLRKTNEVVSLVGFSEALTRLRSSGTILFTSSNQSADYVVFPNYEIPQADIDSWSVAYFASPDKAELTPLFLFYSRAKDTASGDVVFLTTAVPAAR